MSILHEVHSSTFQGNVFNNVAGDLTKIESHYHYSGVSQPPSVLESKAKLAQQMAGQWLLNHEAYLAWKANRPRLLWLMGVPGVNNTFLCSKVVNDTMDPPNPRVAVLKFCCDPQSSNTIGIYDSLLSQLLEKVPSDSPHKHQNTKPRPIRQIITNITDIAREFNKAFVIIDGLYECGSFKAILRGLTSLAEHLHVFVSSHDHPNIRDVFENCEKIIISEEIKSGIQNTLKGGIGSFVQTAVQSIDSRPRRLRLALLLVAFAKRPITVRALAHGVATFEHDEAVTWAPGRVIACSRSLVDGCEHLLTCVPASHYRHYFPNGELLAEDWNSIFGADEIVVPFHSSLRDFLLANPTSLLESLTPHSPNTASAQLYRAPKSGDDRADTLRDVHSRLANLCFVHLDLLRKSNAQLDMQHSDYPFAKYALFALRSHVRESGQAWAAILETKNNGELASLAWLAVRLEIIPWLDMSDLATGGDYGLNTLHMAAKYSASLSTINRLLEKATSQVNQVSGDHYSATPLHFAVKYHRQPVEVVQRLLKDGADVNKKAAGNDTTLHTLMKRPDPEVAISCMDLLMDLLLEHDADVTAPASASWTPLHVLARYTQRYCHKLAKSFLRQANINALDTEERTPLHWAVEAGRPELVTLLLKRGANIDVVDQHGNTPLSLAQKAVDAKNESQRAHIERLLYDAAYRNLRIWSGVLRIGLPVLKIIPLVIGMMTVATLVVKLGLGPAIAQKDSPQMTIPPTDPFVRALAYALTKSLTGSECQSGAKCLLEIPMEGIRLIPVN